MSGNGRMCGNGRVIKKTILHSEHPFFLGLAGSFNDSLCLSLTSQSIYQIVFFITMDFPGIGPGGLSEILPTEC
jgi:hypothetical protein